MTRFPELPPLPDLALPVKKLAEAGENAAEALKGVDEAGQQFAESAKKAKENLDKIVKRKPLP